jgi:hypothetical protein
MNKGYVMFYATKDGYGYCESPRLKDFFSDFKGPMPTEIIAIFRPNSALEFDDISPDLSVAEKFFFVYTDSAGFLQTKICDAPYKVHEIMEDIYMDRYEPADEDEDEDEEMDTPLFYAFSSISSPKVAEDKVATITAWANYVNLRPFIKDQEDLDVLDSMISRNLNLTNM